MLINTKLFNIHDVAMIALVAILAVAIGSRVTAMWSNAAGDDIQAQG